MFVCLCLAEIGPNFISPCFLYFLSIFLLKENSVNVSK